MNARNMPSIKKVAKEKLRYLHLKKLNTQHKLNVEVTRRLVLVTQDLNRVSADEVNYWKQYAFLLEQVQNSTDRMNWQIAHMRAKVHNELEQELVASKERLEQERKYVVTEKNMVEEEIVNLERIWQRLKTTSS